MTAHPAATPFPVEQIRSDFPILQTQAYNKPLVYLDSAASAQRPQSVIDAISKAYQAQYGNVHRGSHYLSDTATELYEESRTRVAQLINAAKPEEVIFTAGTTGAINTVSRSWGDSNVREGDEILLTELEHHSNIVPWQQLAERTGAAVKFIPLSDDGRLNDPLSHIGEQTKVVAIAAISNVLGTIVDLEPIVAKAHDNGAVVVVDGAQAVPHSSVDVKALDIDFLAFSGHKMMGPSGIGILWGREALLESMPPFLGGGSMIQTVTTDGYTPAMLPAKFEAGTPPIVPAIALKAAIDYLEKVGLENLASHEHYLNGVLHDRLNAWPEVRILGPSPKEKAGIVSFVHEGIHASDLAQYLDSNGVAIRAGHHCAMPLHARFGINASCRVSFYCYNNESDIDAFIAAMEKARKLFLRK